MDPIRTYPDADDGFTLVELMTVVMIIAVLIAILIPNFLQARRPAEDRQTESLLREGLTSAAVAQGDGTTPPTASALAAVEPGVQFVDGATTATARRHRVSVASGTADGSGYVLLASHSASGRCYAVLARPEAAPRYQRVDRPDCKAADFDPSTGWAGEWP
jgi:type IV pilus assembly protein PilA